MINYILMSLLRNNKERVGVFMNNPIEITGTLENWYIKQVTNEEFIIWGEIYNDVHKRFDDGTFVHTSGIKNRKVKDGDIVNTRNSIYKLGKKGS